MAPTVTRWLGLLTAALARAPMLTPASLVRVYLLAVGGCSMVFYLVPLEHYDHHVILPASLAAFAGLPLARHERLQPWLVHGVTAFVVPLLLYMASRTGGIHSHVLVWLCVLPAALMLLRGVGAALVWAAINLMGLAMLYLASAKGLFNPGQLVTEHALPWALMNKVLVLCGLLVVVLIYDHQYRCRRRGIDQQNLELRRVHRTLMQTQTHKDEFLAAMSHELRTPMNAILGFNGVLCQEFSDQPDHLEMAGHIRRSTERLLRVVNDILDFSQLAAGRLSLHQTDFDLHDMLRQAIAAHTPQAQDKGLACSLEMAEGLPQHVHGDRQRLRQVIDNLLENAIRFTSRGQVCLRAGHSADKLRFEVQDTGCGIAPDRHSEIFSAWESADLQAPWNCQGTGLGLALCERLLRLQSGRIGVSSQPGQGALFWFELPRQAASRPMPTPSSAPELPSGRPLRILVVDDNDINLMVASLQLRNLWPRAEIVLADSGRQALELMAQQDFDLALIDVLMPEMDGLALTARIRALPGRHKANMPIVALTANHQPAEQARCLAAGMDAVACKPIEPQALRQCVGLALQKERT